MSEFHLLIDDVRELNMDYTARDGIDGLRALDTHPVTHLYMDHDLGEQDTTGYDVLVFALEAGICPPNVLLVTSNPVGRQNMANALLSYDYTQTGNWFRRPA